MTETETIKWSVRTTLEKRKGDINQCKTPEERIEWLKTTRPYEIKILKGNCLLNEGLDLLFSLATGQGGVSFSNSTAQMGVGNSNVAAARTQTDLQGSSTSWKGQEVGYPTTPGENVGLTGRCTKFKSSWGASDGNFNWEEWSIRNSSGANLNLNRKVEYMGTKSGGTWTLEVEVSLT